MFWHQMRQKYLKIWFLLVYWVLLMNLGPSLHRAQFFGLHCHHCSDSCTDKGHSHSDMAPEQLRQHLACCHGCHAFDSVDEVNSGKLLGDDDCSFCRFFAQYNVVLSVFILECSSAPIELCSAHRDWHVDSVTLDPLARGPPATTCA